MDETSEVTKPSIGDAIVTFNGETSSQPESRIVRITPDVAADWLDRNTHNRKLRAEYVTTLAQAMLRGEWLLNGDAIRFSTQYVLLDGQHRLWALLEASQTKPDVFIDSFVTFNLPPETQDTVDGGRKRVIADVLKMRGETNTMQLAATLNRLHLWELGEAAMRFAGGNRLTAAQAIAKLDAEPHIRTAVRIGTRIRGQLGNTLAVSLVASCLYRFDQIDHADSLEFWRQVSSGENLGRNDPAYRLRDVITKNANKRQKLPQLVLHALIVKAWNAFREGREVKALAWKMGGKNPEKFPEPV